MEEKVLRKPPTEMPTKPEELLAFVAWPDYYEGETEEEYNKRQALCQKLAKDYAEYVQMIKILDQDINRPRVWVPTKKGHRK